jgi:hypothetical protein
MLRESIVFVWNVLKRETLLSARDVFERERVTHLFDQFVCILHQLQFSLKQLLGCQFDVPRANFVLQIEGN